MATPPRAPPSDRPLVLLPGLGADARLFDPQRAAIPDLVVPDWIPVRPGDDLGQYAIRLARTIAPLEPRLLGGVSLGGMLALEVARCLELPDVVLIASAATGLELAAGLRMVIPISRLLRLSWLRRIPGLQALALRPFGAHPGAQQQLIADMLADAPADLLDWGPGAIRAWRPARLPRTRVHRIHGGRDRIIPCPPAHHDLLVIPGGGHLVNVTHAGEVNARLTTLLDSPMPATD
jgi:pimeloyl-ACP methyl ester carboxylesterase